MAIDKCIKQLSNRAAQNTVLRAKRIILQFVCCNYCHMTQVKLNELRTKDKLYAAATAWVHAQHTVRTLFNIQQVEENAILPGNSVQKGKTSSTTGAVLGKDIMEAIWADMALTELPSWVMDIPRNWGTATCGKLCANNWRVICTIHLPITLIRLWGRDDAPEDQKHKHQNFMDLVCAVQIANLRLVSKQDIKRYEHYIQRYLVGLKSLYKLVKVKPIHHTALHYSETLRSFGLAHTHGAASYERYIHSMQTQNHNIKLGL